MPLDALDHLILDRRMNAALGAAANTRELQQTLAEQAGAHQGYRAIVRTLLNAYGTGDWVTIEAILGNHNTRNGIYHSAFDPTYNSLKPF